MSDPYRATLPPPRPVPHRTARPAPSQFGLFGNIMRRVFRCNRRTLEKLLIEPQVPALLARPLRIPARRGACGAEPAKGEAFAPASFRPAGNARAILCIIEN